MIRRWQTQVGTYLSTEKWSWYIKFIQIKNYTHISNFKLTHLHIYDVCLLQWSCKLDLIDIIKTSRLTKVSPARNREDSISVPHTRKSLVKGERFMHLLRIAECIYLAIAVPPNGKMFIKISIRIISCHVPNRYCWQYDH